MECNDKNKRKFQCGKKTSSACTEYAGWLPRWSELNLEDCVTVEEVLEEQYHVLDNILTAINVSDLGRACIDYPASKDKRTVAMVLAAFEDIICNSRGYTSKVYTNDRFVATATKKDIPSGFVGTEVDYIVQEGTHVSAVSQDDANSLAKAEADANVQEYANQFGSYSAKIFYNKKVSQDFVKDDCPANASCGAVTYTVKAGEYTSTVSQEEADDFAMEEIRQKGQAYANAVGKCKKVYFSKYVSHVFYKNDCQEGYGDAVGFEYSLPNGTIISEISQHDADQRALDKMYEEGQQKANQYGSCSVVFYNKEVGAFFTRKDCGTGYQGKSKYYSIEAGTCKSFESQEDADLQAKELLYKKGNMSIRLEGECIEKYWAVQAYAYPAGTATVTCPTTARDGDWVEYEAEAEEDFSITRVVINGEEMSTRGRFIIDKASTIKVYTKSDVQYKVSVVASPEEGGVVSITAGNGVYPSGAPCVIEGLPNPGYSFGGWQRNGATVSLSKNYAFIVDRNTDGEYKAIFYKEGEE